MCECALALIVALWKSAKKVWLHNRSFEMSECSKKVWKSAKSEITLFLHIRPFWKSNCAIFLKCEKSAKSNPHFFRTFLHICSFRKSDCTFFALLKCANENANFQQVYFLFVWLYVKIISILFHSIPQAKSRKILVVLSVSGNGSAFSDSVTATKKWTSLNYYETTWFCLRQSLWGYKLPVIRVNHLAW